MLNKRCVIGASRGTTKGWKVAPARIVCFEDADMSVEAIGDAARAIMPPR